ncbi:hypothetical protein N303_10907 [Cuculus canorus]|uniref:Interleukin-5 n=1 Tax=Cuculus canorus TaxID=55661 RepID=A0A091FHH4_CUCCA|nr:hypothetical protein N303_10907 [Cuculus canorus]
MKTHLYLLLLAAGISAVSQASSMAELLTLLQQMSKSMTTDKQASSISILLIENLLYQILLIETPDNIDDMNCVSTIFEGTEQLKTNPTMAKFSVFFQKFEQLRPSLTASLAREGKCNTERTNATTFIGKLMTFIRIASKKARV